MSAGRGAHAWILHRGLAKCHFVDGPERNRANRAVSDEACFAYGWNPVRRGSEQPLIRPAGTFSPLAGRREHTDGALFPSPRTRGEGGAQRRVRGCRALDSPCEHPESSRTETAPHPPCGHLLPACGEKGAYRRRAFPSPRTRGEGGAQRRVRGCRALDFPCEHPESSRTETAPHPPCGHLLPACGEKGTCRRRAFPLAPQAGRGWRVAPGEGLSRNSLALHRKSSRTETDPHPPCGHLLPAFGEKGTCRRGAFTLAASARRRERVSAMTQAPPAKSYWRQAS